MPSGKLAENFQAQPVGGEQEKQNLKLNLMKMKFKNITTNIV